ncbi:MAG: DUF4416 family protein [Deltaproteobacteria bacterium]|nr:DUF4416 family protein [Deltaproteobacteria bacterium]
MKPKGHDRVKLIASLFTAEAGLFGEVLKRLEDRFGPADLLSEPMEFSHTAYYDSEFGGPIRRKMASFEPLMEIGELAEIKLFTNALEDEYLREGGGRRINIDPGYLTLDKLVLASCKDFSHRIYLSGGVYAEVTLMYVGHGFTALPWTYPDYRDGRMTALLKEIRRRYAHKLGKGV